MPHWPIGNWHKSKKYNLDYPLKLSNALGNPHLKLPPVIHVAGTNGKGSSVAMLKAIFEAAGYKVHTYTSPHLVEFNERIILAGEKIDDDYLFNIIERARLAALKINEDPQFFFEGITVAAFLAFSEVKADILILETGVGGRLDATNIIPSPMLSLITPVSYDHMDYLGSTLPLIAGEKAGIIKQNSICVISAQTEEVNQVLFSKCANVKVPAFAYEYDFGIEKTASGFKYFSKKLTSEFLAPSLAGDHQLINASTCIASITLINDKFKITNTQISQGLQNTHWPARLQKIAPAKYSKWAPASVNIWVDGAHNSSGAQVLSHWVHENLKSQVYLILGMTKNRNVTEFCGHFKDIVTAIYGVKVNSESDSYSARNLAKITSEAGIEITPSDSISDAISEINARSTDANIVVCGSLFLAADLFKLLGSI
jgi:dihydrofolate synthase/folylpolyglutamate synthase